MRGAKDPEPTPLDAFNAEVAKEHLAGQWLVEPQIAKLADGPLPICDAYLWKWDRVRERLMQTFDVLPEAAAARRNLSFLNPKLPRGTTPTMSAGIQLIGPGELARAHAHSMNAIRFVTEGDANLYTVVDGVKCPMEDYDLVLTPAYSWHYHHNLSGKFVSWLDVIDSPLYVRLNQGFFVPYDGIEQPLRNVASEVGPGWLQPEGERREPFLRFRWKDAHAQLLAKAGQSHDGDVVLNYINPLTGGPTLKTMSCSVQLLKPGHTTTLRRDTSSAVQFVVAGEGETVIGDLKFKWGRHDSIARPNWAWYSHTNLSKTDNAILFSVSDAPALQALGMYREEIKAH
jgi:gentisate 1,2-dioxygenase